jgi:hypothetical protein
LLHQDAILSHTIQLLLYPLNLRYCHRPLRDTRIPKDIQRELGEVHRGSSHG